MISLRQVKGGVSWSLILEMRWSQQREACSHTGNILEESGPVEGCVRLGKVSLSPRPPPMPSSCLREDVYVRRFKCISTGAGAEMKLKSGPGVWDGRAPRLCSPPPCPGARRLTCAHTSAGSQPSAPQVGLAEGRTGKIQRMEG